MSQYSTAQHERTSTRIDVNVVYSRSARLQQGSIAPYSERAKVDADVNIDSNMDRRTNTRGKKKLTIENELRFPVQFHLDLLFVFSVFWVIYLLVELILSSVFSFFFVAILFFPFVFVVDVMTAFYVSCSPRSTRSSHSGLSPWKTTRGAFCPLSENSFLGTLHTHSHDWSTY